MKVDRNLKIQNYQFFDSLIQGVIIDIEKNTNKKILKSDLKKGFKFNNKNKQNPLLNSTFEIIDFIPNELYSAKQTTVNGTRFISFKITTIKDGINVEFQQSLPKSNKKQLKLFSLFSETIYLGRMTDFLYNIERQIVKNT
ncbi:MAG: DUF3284 domain-containing protein [Erysipelotrichaceae bacterium]|nr:DUF3284 domain-containing protein [Erysipelotrichaceae bacterium]MDY5252922.1 DUF3284 domain-containing protein [Erysipelotrichaceae bacterium]